MPCDCEPPPPPADNASEDQHSLIHTAPQLNAVLLAGRIAREKRYPPSDDNPPESQDLDPANETFTGPMSQAEFLKHIEKMAGSAHMEDRTVRIEKWFSRVCPGGSEYWAMDYTSLDRPTGKNRSFDSISSFRANMADSIRRLDEVRPGESFSQTNEHAIASSSDSEKESAPEKESASK